MDILRYIQTLRMMRMAKHIALTLLLVTLAVPSLLAQEMEWSNTEKFRNRTAYSRILGQNTTGIYVLRSRSRFMSRRVYVQMFRENMGQVYSKLLPGMKHFTFKEGYVYPDGLSIFKTRYNNKNSRIELFAQKYTVDAEPVGEDQFISSTPQRDYSDEGDYAVRVSMDRSKILCFHTEITGAKTTVVEMIVLDGEKLVELGRKKVELPFRYGNFTPLEMEISNNGNAYFIFRVENEDLKKRDFERFGYYVFAYDIAEGSLKDYYLNNEDTYLSRPKLSIDYLTNKIIASCYYSFEDAGYSKGIVDFAIDAKTHTLLHKNFLPYPKEFVGDVIGPNAAERGEELRDLFIKKIIPHTDSGYLLLAEEYYTTSQTYTFTINGMMQVGSRDVFNFGKIVVLSVGKNGEIQWGKVINKNQASSLDLGYYSSVYIMPMKDKINIFYNDDDRGQSEVTLFTLDTHGKLESRLLFKNQNSSIALVPREGQQLDAITVLFPAAKDRKFAFVKFMVN